jgi:hypothetical protein
VASSSSTFRVHGLDELVHALDLVGHDLPEALRHAGETVAGKEAKAARARAHTIGGVAAHSADAVYADMHGDVAGIGLDGSSYPTAWGAEFGAKAYPQFGSYIGPDNGYFLYPTVAADEDQVAEAYSDALGQLLQKANLA